MKLYNSILSNVDDSIKDMDIAIDSFNIFGVYNIGPTDAVYDFCKTCVDFEELKGYTSSFNINYIDYLNDLIVDPQLAEITVRTVYYICGKLLSKVNTKEWTDVWQYDNLKINLNNIIHNCDTDFYAHTLRYKSGYDNYILNIMITKGPEINYTIVHNAVILVSYKNNL